MAPMGPKRSFLLSLLVALVLFAGSCGGGGGDGASEETASSDTTASTDTTDTTAPVGQSTDTTDTTAPVGQGGQRSGTGAPIGRPSGGATGAPVRIPAIVQVGNRLDNTDVTPDGSTLLEFIRSQFRQACGGSLCVTLTIVDQKGRPGNETCRFRGFEPSASSSVPRGSVVKILATCDDPSGDSGSTPTSDGGTP